MKCIDQLRALILRIRLPKMLSPSLFSLSLYATKAIILCYLTISAKIIKTEKQTYLQKGNIKLLVWWSGRFYYGSPKDLKKEIIHLQQSLRLIVVYIIELGKSNKTWLHKVDTINIFSNQCANYNNYWWLLFCTINNTISTVNSINQTQVNVKFTLIM